MTTDSALAQLIAFNLPQYHQTPENDSWWGEGFTEWTNVRKAVPQFPNHEQPRVPTGLGYYDLTDPQTHHWQQELARQHGIAAFCHYVYWFGGKRLLERPLEVIRDNKDLTLPYCFCWANENWTRRWDGRDDLILQGQCHDAQQDARIIDDLAEHLTDPRYLRVNGRPLLLIWRHSILDNPRRTTDLMRERAQELGIGELHLATVQSWLLRGEPSRLGFDSAIEFQPELLREGVCSLPYEHPQSRAVRQTPSWNGTVLSYERAAAYAMARPVPDYPWHRTVMTSWDNTPRRGERGIAYHDATPARFQEWLERALEYTYLFAPPGERFVFINAWNEWGEGAYLEPDEHLGLARLEAVHNALESTRELAVRTGDAAVDDSLLALAQNHFRTGALAAHKLLARHGDHGLTELRSPSDR